MINLNDHSCYHCKHLNRKSRTQHGWLAEQYRYYDQKLYELAESGKYGSLSFYRDKRDLVFQLMRQLEQGQNRVVDNYNARDRSKKTTWVPWYPEDEKYWEK